MKDFYEGSVSGIDDNEEWSEPYDVLAVTPEIAAQEIIEAYANEVFVNEKEEMNICLRQINIDGDPLSEWEYFRGWVWPIYRSEVKRNELANSFNGKNS